MAAPYFSNRSLGSHFFVAEGHLPSIKQQRGHNHMATNIHDH